MPHFFLTSMGIYTVHGEKNLMDCSKTTCVSNRERCCFNYAPTCAGGGGVGYTFSGLEVLN